MTGIDGYDWASVGWSNPVPGDPDVARQIAGQIQDLSDEVGRQNFLLSSVGPESAGFWSGPAADAFRPIAAKLPPELEKLVSSYGDAAAAVNGYWPKHRAAQSLAVAALSKAQAAHQAIGAAQQQVGSLQSQSSSAAQAYNQASTKAANPSGSTPDPNAAANVANLQTQYRAAQNQLGAAQSALASAQSDLGAAESMRQQAVDQWNTAASALSGLLHAASSAGVHNIHRGLFSSLGHDITSLVSSGAHGLEGFAKAQIAAVVQTGDDIGRIAEDAGHYAEDGYSAVAHFAKDNMGILKSIDTVLNYVSTGLGVLAIVCQPIPGLDAVVDLASDTVLLAKTADDGLELMGGDQGAEAELVEDGIGLATAGTSKILDGAADDARAATEVTQDGEDATRVTGATEDGAQGAGAGGGGGTDEAGAEDGAGAAGGPGRGDEDAAGAGGTGGPASAGDEDAAGAGGTGGPASASEEAGDGGGPAGADDDAGATAGGGDPDGSDDEATARHASGGDDAGAGPAGDDGGDPATGESPPPTTAASEPAATPTPAGSDDGQMPPSHEAGSPPAADSAGTPAPASPEASAAPRPGEPPAAAAAPRPGDTPAGSPHAEPAPPGKIATLLGKRDYQEFIKAKNSGHFLHAMDRNDVQVKYADSLATKLQETTHGRFHVARTIMTIHEDAESVDDADKAVHTWVTDHSGDHGAAPEGDDDKFDAAFAEKLVLG